jgi:hypothetical protein
MIHPTCESRWRDLEANAHLPEVQEIIRREIRDGTIRVRPKPGGGIRIMPVGEPESEEAEEIDPLPATFQNGASPSKAVVRLAGHRLARRQQLPHADGLSRVGT